MVTYPADWEKVKLADLEDYKNDLLNVTPREEKLKFKYVFQTQITADTVNERIRSALGLFNDEETFIDNDASLLMDRLHEYYT